MVVRHIYVASLFSRMAEAAALAAILRAEGHVVVSTWHEGSSEGKSVPHDPAERRKYALQDKHEVIASDLLVVLAVPKGVPFLGGAHCTEYGIAIGRNTECVCMGDVDSNLFYNLPETHSVQSAVELLAWLRSK